MTGVGRSERTDTRQRRQWQALGMDPSGTIGNENLVTSVFFGGDAQGQAGGDDQQIQFNSDGQLDGVPGFTWDGSILTFTSETQIPASDSATNSNINIQGLAGNGIALFDNVSTNGVGLNSSKNSNTASLVMSSSNASSFLTFSGGECSFSSTDSRIDFSHASGSEVRIRDQLAADPTIAITTSGGFDLQFTTGSISSSNLVFTLPVADGNAGDPLVTDGSGALSFEATSGTSFPGSPRDGQQFYRTDLDEMFTYDSGRAKWLGPPLQYFFGRNGTISSGGLPVALRAAGNVITNSTRGWYINRDITIVGWEFHHGTSGNVTFEVNRGGTNVISGSTSSSRNAADYTANADFSAGSTMDAEITAVSTASTSNALVMLHVRRNAT